MQAIPMSSGQTITSNTEQYEVVGQICLIEHFAKIPSHMSAKNPLWL